MSDLFLSFGRGVYITFNLIRIKPFWGVEDNMYAKKINQVAHKWVT